MIASPLPVIGIVRAATVRDDRYALCSVTTHFIAERTGEQMGNPHMSFLFPSTDPSASVEEVWTTAFYELRQRIKRSFRRPETHLHALAYVQGLMSPAERKNGWQV